MRRSVLTVLAALAVLLVVPRPKASALQTVALGSRDGTLGIGADVSVAWSDWFILRAGASVLALDADLTPVSGLVDNLTARAVLPNAFYTVGAEAERGMFRFGAGILYKHRDPRLVFSLGDGASIDIGRGRYTALEITELTATLRSDAWAPYAVAGLGEHNAGGLDFFVDVGVAFLVGSELVLAAAGESDLLRSSRFRENLGVEQLSIRRDLGSLIDFWPILNFGIRYGFGGRESNRRPDNLPEGRP